MDISNSVLLQNLIKSLHGLKPGGKGEEELPEGKDGMGVEVIKIMGDKKPMGIMEPEKEDEHGALAALLGGGEDEDCEPDDDEEDDHSDLIKFLKG